MNLFLLNLCLACLVAALVGVFSIDVFLSGFLLGFIALWLVRPFTARSAYFRTFCKALLYLFYVAWELLLSSLRVAWVIISPRPQITPGIVAVPLKLKSDGAIFLLANSITLTPGTLSLDVSADKKTLYVHGMFIQDPEDFRKEIRAGFEHKIAEFMK